MKRNNNSNNRTRPAWSLPSAVSIMLERLWPRLIPRTTALEGRSTLGPLETVAAAVTSGGGVLFSERAVGGWGGGALISLIASVACGGVGGGWSLTDVALGQHVGHRRRLRLLVGLMLALVLGLVLRLIQGLVLGFVLRLRLRLGVSVGQRGRGRGGGGRALTGAADPSIRALQVCVDGRRSDRRRLPGGRGLVFGARR